MKSILTVAQYSLIGLLLALSVAANAAEDKLTYQFEISGVEKPLADNILIFLNNLAISCDASESMRDSLKEQIPEQVQLAVQPFGYYQAKIESIESKATNGCWRMMVKVSAGESVHIRTIDFSIDGPGSDHPQIKDIKVEKSIKVGSVFIDTEYQHLKQQLRQWATNYGFLDADFSLHKVDVYPQQQAVDIKLTFDTGPRYRLDKVVIEQDPEFMQPLFLERLVGLEDNQYINNQSLIDVRKRLVGSQYFGNITVTFGEKNTEAASVPVLIKLTPGHRVDYSIGLGFTTDTGARSTFEYQHHRLNDRGYQLSSKLQLAEVNNEFLSRMKFPSFSNPDEKWYQTEIGYRQQKNDVYDANTTKIGISQTRLQSEKWQNINFIDLLQEDYTFGDKKGSTQLLVPGTAWTFQKVDNPLNPRYGFKAQMDFKLASENLFSDMSMLQISGRVKSILPIGTIDRLIMRAEIGTTATSDFEKLPASYRYFAGGDQSVRGFNYKNLSPRNKEGDFIGGKHLVVASVEYEHRINEKYALAIFTDGGNSFTDKFEMAGSVGIGFRWFSPIGPLRVDLGFPVTESEHDFRIHLSLGPDL